MRTRKTRDPICYACDQRHDRDDLCQPMRDYLWAIVKGGKRSESRAVRWAAAHLGLDEQRYTPHAPRTED